VVLLTTLRRGPDVAEHDTDKEQPKAAPETEAGLIEKAFLMGMGAAFIAKDKAEELADEMVKRGRMTREESDSFASRLVNQADSAADSAQKTVSEETAKVVKRMGLASKEDLAKLENELTEIKALIASLRPVEGGSSES
jgi:polyhydroxyalkanoate synthesis regulator phasin